MVAQSLIVSFSQVSTFTTNLAWQLRFWLIGLPGGISYATLKAILKLWLGFKPEHSGIFSLRVMVQLLEALLLVFVIPMIPKSYAN